MKQQKAHIQIEETFGLDLSEMGVVAYQTGGFLFEAFGFSINNSYTTLPVTLKVCLHPHIHEAYVFYGNINLYDNNAVNHYCREAAQKLQKNVEELQRAVGAFRDRLEKYKRAKALLSTEEEKDCPASIEEQKEAKAILKSNNLLQRIEELLIQAGIGTESKNALRLFLVLLSRQLDKPLHVLLQGSTQLSRRLLETLSETIPSNQIRKQTSISKTPIYYPTDKNYYKNKVLYLTSIETDFKGAYSIKEFIENNLLRRLTAESDSKTRQWKSTNKIVKGPICLFGYSENEKMNQKFFQECLFIRLEETRQNRAEMEHYMKLESSGQINLEEQARAKRILKEIQNQLQAKRIIIPYALQLELPENIFQPLRSLSQLLTFVQSVALLHQHTLKTKTDASGREYIEASVEHLETAIELFKDVLISRSDILTLAQRNFLERLKIAVKDENASFKIPELIQKMRISKSAFYRDFNSLVESGFVIQTGGNKKEGVSYQVANWEEYDALKQSMNILDEQIKRIKEMGFPQVSHKFPKQQKTSKNTVKQGIEGM